MKRITLFATALLCTAVLMAQTTDPIIRSCSEEYYEYGADGWIKIAAMQRTYDTAGNLYQQVKTEDALTERRTFMHDAEGRQTSVVIEHDTEGWGEYLPSQKIVDGYDPIAKEFNVVHAKYIWDQVEQDWVMTDGSNFRDVERDANGNITSIIIKSYFTHVAAIVPHTKTTITYNAEGKAESYSIQSASDHDATTGVTTWGRANTYKNIEWEDTDGQLYQDVNTMLIGPNRMKYAELYKGSTHAGTLSREGSSGRIFVTHSLDLVEHVRADCASVLLDAEVDDLTELLLLNDEFYLKLELIFGVASVNEAKVLRKRLVEDETTESSLDDL